MCAYTYWGTARFTDMFACPQACSIELYTQSTCVFNTGPHSTCVALVHIDTCQFSLPLCPFCVSCREEFQARKEEAKMLRQKSQEHPPNPCSLLRDERETKYTG